MNSDEYVNIYDSIINGVENFNSKLNFYEPMTQNMIGLFYPWEEEIENYSEFPPLDTKSNQLSEDGIPSIPDEIPSTVNLFDDSHAEEKHQIEDTQPSSTSPVSDTASESRAKGLRGRPKDQMVKDSAVITSELKKLLLKVYREVESSFEGKFFSDLKNIFVTL
jgi:hypothetical protein